VITKSAQETKKFGEQFARKIKSGGVVCLYGDLGAGKTTLVQGIARGLGIKKRVTSPTFILMRQYDNLYHIDLYRLDEVKNLGLEELWQDEKNILLIEWAEKIESILPNNRWVIQLKQMGENEREITVKRHAN